MAFRKQYRSAKGVTIDMEIFKQANENTKALGNLGGPNNVNAKGDFIDAKGNVIKKREEIVRQHYRQDLPKVKEQSIRTKLHEEPKLKDQKLDNDEVFVSPEVAIKKIQEEAASSGPTSLSDIKPKRKAKKKTQE